MPEQRLANPLDSRPPTPMREVFTTAFWLRMPFRVSYREIHGNMTPLVATIDQVVTSVNPQPKE